MFVRSRKKVIVWGKDDPAVAVRYLKTRPGPGGTSLVPVTDAADSHFSYAPKHLYTLHITGIHPHQNTCKDPIPTELSQRHYGNPTASQTGVVSISR